MCFLPSIRRNLWLVPAIIAVSSYFSVFLAVSAGEVTPVPVLNPGGPDTMMQATIVTSLGEIELLLDSEQAPKTVENFLRYAREGFYENTLFHRVIPDFMIQGGGIGVNFQEKKPNHNPILNEAANGLKNIRGSIAMARTSDPQSATSQFFINLKNNHFLDFTSPTRQGWGYAVFGRVISGMDTVDKIAQVVTGSIGPYQNTPTEQPLVIIKVIVNTS